MTQKKLSLDGTKKTVLIDALAAAAEAVDGDMSVIYRETARQAREAADRILLTDAQVSIARSALSLHGHGPEAADMIDQLRLTRKQYAQLHPVPDPA